MSYLDDFKAVFSRDGVLEHEIQRYMEENTEVIPIPSLLGHGLFWDAVFPQFLVDREKVDFMYITKNTFEMRVVLIEIERPGKQLFRRTGHVDFYSDTRQAIAQIESWKGYIQNNRETFQKSLGILIPQTMNFSRYPMQVEYVLIIGRNERGQFSHKQRTLLTTLQNDSGIQLLTYDSIIRAQGAFLIGEQKDVLAYAHPKIRLKHSNVEDTALFGSFYKDQLILTPDQKDRYKSLGYNMDAWLSGELLSLNNKYTSEQLNEIFMRNK